MLDDEIQAKFDDSIARLAKKMQEIKPDTKYTRGLLLEYPHEAHPTIYDPTNFEPKKGPTEWFIVMAPELPFKGIEAYSLARQKIVYISRHLADQMIIHLP